MCNIPNKICIQNAEQHHIPNILSLIKSHHNYKNILKQGLKESNEGFLLANISQAECQKLISDDLIFVARKGNKIAGVLVATRPTIARYENLPNPIALWEDKRAQAIYNSNRFLYLWVIAIQKAYCRQGIGKLLVEKLKTMAAMTANKGILVDFMKTPILNARSKAFFEAIGFKACGDLKISDYFGVGKSTWHIYYYSIDDKDKNYITDSNTR